MKVFKKVRSQIQVMEIVETDEGVLMDNVELVIVNVNIIEVRCASECVGFEGPQRISIRSEEK